MSKAKKLNLNFEDLCNIAKAINENIIANRLRSIEDRMPTDKFLRVKFNINRKDFGFTAKDIGIKYNPTTFFYEMPDHKSNIKVLHNIEQQNLEHKLSNPKVVQEVAATCEEFIKEKEFKEDKSNALVMQNNLNDIMPELLEMLNWYKQQKDSTNETLDNNAKSMELDLGDPKLSGAVGSHTLKCYEGIYNEFVEVCKQYKSCKKQDLLSIALLDFVKKYKK